MLYPPMNELLKKVNSRYLMVNVVSRRARQISIETEQSGIPTDEKPVSLAIDEIYNGELTARVKDEYSDSADSEAAQEQQD